MYIYTHIYRERERCVYIRTTSARFAETPTALTHQEFSATCQINAPLDVLPWRKRPIMALANVSSAPSCWAQSASHLCDQLLIIS